MKSIIQQKECIGCGKSFYRKDKPSNFTRNKYCSFECRTMHYRGEKCSSYKHGMYIAGNIEGRRLGKRLAENKRRSNGGGYFSKSEWEQIKKDFDYRCRLCAKKDTELTLDHRIPLSLGGAHDKGNIQPLCKSCNSKKKNRLVLRQIDWLSSGRIIYSLGKQIIPTPLGKQSDDLFTVSPQEWSKMVLDVDFT